MAEHIHPLPSWFPWAGGTLGTRSHVWIKPGMEAAVLPHERVHLAQARRIGTWRFRLWWLSASGRVALESEAYAVDVMEGRLSLHQAAQILSGPKYGTPCTYVEALRAIDAWVVR